MLIFVDYEHADSREASWGQRNLAARTWITYRLEDLSGLPCHLVRYDRVTTGLLERLDAEAIFVSGNGSDPEKYDAASLQPLHEIMRSSVLPTFGFCGGFQMFSEALGAELVPLDPAPDTADSDILQKHESGAIYEFGYHPVSLDGHHELLDGLGDAPVFRHAHRLHVPNPPSGFEVLASTEHTPVQLAVSEERRMVGTQFHPEYWTDEHPSGKTLIANFLNWAGITNG